MWQGRSVSRREKQQKSRLPRAWRCSSSTRLYNTHNNRHVYAAWPPPQSQNLSALCAVIPARSLCWIRAISTLQKQARLLFLAVAFTRRLIQKSETVNSKSTK